MISLTQAFFRRPCDRVARELVGKCIVRGDTVLRITETEVYWGENDTACHAHKGRTRRTEVMYADGGTLYVYLCYGIHWMLNIVTGPKEDPQAVLIRACAEAPGPGKLTKKLGITGEYNGLCLPLAGDLWIGDDGIRCTVSRHPRVGIGYASEEDRSRLWRFKMEKVMDCTSDNSVL